LVVRVAPRKLLTRAAKVAKQPGISRGGAGGAAHAGDGGHAVGGPGGHSGGSPGVGGDGGDAGGGDVVVGGAGGSVDGPDIWFPPAVSGYEVYMKSIGEKADPSMKPFGRGGPSGDYLWRFQRVEQLRVEFFAAHDLVAKTIDEDILAMPLDQLNQALATAGETWRAKINDYDQYVFFSA